MLATSLGDQATGAGFGVKLAQSHCRRLYQEIWDALIAYNLLRREIDSTASEAKIELTDISFVRALHMIPH